MKAVKLSEVVTIFMERIAAKNTIVQGTLLILTCCTWFLSQTQVQENKEWERWAYLGGYLLAYALFLRFRKGFEAEVAQNLRLIMFTTLLLLFSIAAWNYVFHLYSDAFSFNRDIFRGAFESKRAPLYTSVHLFFKFPERYAGLFAIPITYFIIFTYKTDKWNRKWLWLTSIYLLLAIVSYAITDGVSERLLANCVHFESFYRDALQFTHPKALLSDYVSIMDDLSRSSHYPPGNVCLMFIERNTFPYFSKTVVLLSAVSAIYPMYRMMLLLKVDVKTMNIAVALYAFSTVLPVYSSFSMMPLLIPLGLFILYFGIRYSIEGRISNAAKSGLFAVLFAFFSFSFVLIGLVLIFFMINTLLQRTISLYSLGRFALVFLLTFSVCYLLLYWISGFNLLECFMHAVGNNTESMSNGFDNWYRYLLRSTANLIAFFGILGVPLVAYGFLSLVDALKKRHSRLFTNFTVSVFAAIFLSGFSGLFFLETERIWMIFIPLLCIIAGVNLGKLSGPHSIRILKFTLLLSLLLSMGEELFIDHSCHHFSFGW